MTLATGTYLKCEKSDETWGIFRLESWRIYFLENNSYSFFFSFFFTKNLLSKLREWYLWNWWIDWTFHSLLYFLSRTWYIQSPLTYLRGLAILPFGSMSVWRSISSREKYTHLEIYCPKKSPLKFNRFFSCPFNFFKELLVREQPLLDTTMICLDERLKENTIIPVTDARMIF